MQSVSAPVRKILLLSKSSPVCYTFSVKCLLDMTQYDMGGTEFMGFLDKFLNKETKKLISGVMENVVDAVVDNARDALNQSSAGNGSNKPAVHNVHEKTDRDEEDCCDDVSVVEARIRKIMREKFSDCELRENISSGEIGAGYISWKYSYGVYRDGIAVAMINILEYPNDYKKKIVLQSKQACKDLGIGYVHFLMHLPNRSSYISERLQEIIPA